MRTPKGVWWLEMIGPLVDFAFSLYKKNFSSLQPIRGSFFTRIEALFQLKITLGIEENKRGNKD